jgi:hypothetical protein
MLKPFIKIMKIVILKEKILIKILMIIQKIL